MLVKPGMLNGNIDVQITTLVIPGSWTGLHTLHPLSLQARLIPVILTPNSVHPGPQSALVTRPNHPLTEKQSLSVVLAKSLLLEFGYEGLRMV